MRNQYSQQDWQIISAYLDGELSPQEKTRLEARFEKESDLHQAFLDLRNTQLLLKNARQYKAPRNFTLTPEQAMAARPRQNTRLLPILSLSSVLATILMVFTIMLELTSGPSLIQNIASAPAADIYSYQMESQAETAADSSAAATPMIIQWGQPPGMGGGGPAVGMGGGDSGLTLKSLQAEPAMGSVEAGDLGIESMQEPLPATPPESLPEPLQAAPPASLPEEPSQPAIAAEPMGESEPITGAGPILGIRAEDEAQSYNRAAVESLEAQNTVNRKMARPGIPYLRWIQIGLAVIALACAGTVLYLKRKLSA